MLFTVRADTGTPVQLLSFPRDETRRKSLHPVLQVTPVDLPAAAVAYIRVNKRAISLRVPDVAPLAVTRLEDQMI